MKFLISADMEGATGVTWPADCEPGTPEWQRCRPMFTSDVNGAVAGLFDGGATEVMVNEAHATMRNLLLEDLDERATMITGRHKSMAMIEGIQAGDTDGLVFIGYHAGAGTEGVLAHTYLPNSITGVWVNGEPASEGRLNALVAGEYGTPVVLVTGDDKACEDAKSYAADAKTVAVKDYVSRYAARCRPPSRTFTDIRKTAQAAASLATRRSPTADAAPYRVEIEVDATQLADFATMVPTVERAGERRVSYTTQTGPDMLRCFKAVTTLISSGIEKNYG